MTYYIYVLQNKINNKIYVGQTNNLNKRRREHKAKDRIISKHSPLYQAIQKYGFDNFEMTTIETFHLSSDADDAEEFWIQFFESKNRKFGYNLASGGRVNRGFKHSEEFKKQQSKRKIIYYKDHKAHNYGIPMSVDAKHNLSQKCGGIQSSNSEFTSEEVKDIRILYSSGQYSQTELAKIHNVAVSTIGQIVKYKSYKYI